jgi:hypothetical protein
MRVLAIRHIAFEDLGSFAPVLTKRGFDIDYVEAAPKAYTTWMDRRRRC